MTHRLQKTIIHKYLNLVKQEKTSETQIKDLLTIISQLYSSSVLTERDIYCQKIEIIKNNLSRDYVDVKRKRVTKELKLRISKELREILVSDLEGIDFSKTDISDLINHGENSDFSITKDNVKRALENIIIPKRKVSKEVDIEKFTVEQLSKIFGKEKVHRQYNIGGFLALKTDIDIGNGQVGIEIKIVDKLNATNMQRLIGQVVYYTKGSMTTI